jgi:hypothetical protein
MSTAQLHTAIVRALGSPVLSHTDLRKKPLCIDMALPAPPRLRIYAYSLVAATGTTRSHEYKAVLRVPQQRVNEYGSFDHSDGRFTVLLAYRNDLDVFVLWDASLHPRFKNGGNIQVRDRTVLTAAATGQAEQQRVLTSGVTEIVLACTSPMLLRILDERVRWTGGVTEEEWRHSQT